MAKRVERLVAMLMVTGSIPGGSIEMLGELNSGDKILFIVVVRISQ